MELTSTGAPPRMLPPLDDRSRPLWTGGRDGQLLVERCPSCDRWQHPPTGRCRRCAGPVVHEPVSGQGTVFTYTVNMHQYHPEVPPPYLIAIVELVEQTDLRVVANIVDCAEPELRIGLPVQVAFERDGEHFVPVFAPAEG